MLSLKQEFGKSHGHHPHPPSVDKRNPPKCENIKTFGRRCRTMPRRGLIDHITIAGDALQGTFRVPEQSSRLISIE
jgi:hypothetical protein